MTPRRTLALAAVAIAAASIGLRAHAADPNYPSQPIRIVVPFAPGGATDISARLIGPKLAEALKQPVVIENRAGAGGTVGSEAVSKAPPDGYTLVMATSSTHGAAPSLYKKLGYDPVRDFEPVSLLVTAPFVLAVKKDMPVNSAAELVALARKSPGKLNYASAGVGSVNQLTVELLKMMTNIQVVHVPYKGSGPALADLAGGQVDMIINDMASILGFIRNGTVKPLAVTSMKRNALLPNLPTLDETAAKGYEALAWYGLLAPRGTPPEIVAKVRTALQGILKDPAFHERFVAQGFDVRDETGEAFRDFIRKDVDKWRDVVKASGATLD
jgi:tripartite-type tricarboxylate transporter receptor subunit TctC